MVVGSQNNGLHAEYPAIAGKQSGSLARLACDAAPFAIADSGALIHRSGESLEAGMVGNNSLSLAAPESPLGGLKDSRHGSEEGSERPEACLVSRFVSEA